MNIVKKYKEYVTRYKSDVHWQQAGSLFIWNMVGVFINLAVNFFLTRYLGAEDYGNYAFVERTFAFVFILVNYGLFRSVGRAILLTEDENKNREYYGIGLIIWLVASIISCIFLFVYALLSKNIAEKGILSAFLLLIPLCSVHYLNAINEQVLPSCNKIKLLIVQRYYPRIALMICIIALFFLYEACTFKFILCLALLYGTQFIVYVYVAYQLHPTLTHSKERIKEVFDINKSYGVKVYYGDLCSNAFVALMPLLISFFGLNNADVGFYGLALALCAPMNYIPGAIITSHYKKFSVYKQIPKKVFQLTILASFGSLIILWIIITPFVNIFYTAEYQPVIFLTFITSIGTFLYGMSDFISRYLASQGDGVALRNSSIIVGFTTLVCSLLLISQYAAVGAAITHGLAGICYIGIILYYYYKRVKLNHT